MIADVVPDGPIGVLRNIFASIGVGIFIVLFVVLIGIATGFIRWTRVDPHDDDEPKPKGGAA